MTVQIRLREYEHVHVPLDDERARRLNTAAGPALSVSPGPERGLHTITATNYVGSLTIDGLDVIISPKIRPENLFLLLEAGIPQDRWRAETIDYARRRGLLPAVISFFARTAESVLGRGVLRAYRTFDERLVAMRGRIDVRDQIRQPGIASPIRCTFDEFTPDNAENRYLKAALRRARQVAGTEPEVRRILEHCLVRLEDVADVAVRHDDLELITFNRLNRHYAPALRLARLVLRDLSLLDDHGRTGASSFLVDMNDLFQRFVAGRLQKALRGHLEVDVEPPHHLGERREVEMRPDLAFHPPGRHQPIYVGDAKYKITKDGRARASDYYQMLAYCTALDLAEGVLIYCLHDGDRPPHEVQVRNCNKRLFTVAIDLSGDATEVDYSIRKLAHWVVGRVAMGMAA